MISILIYSLILIAAVCFIRKDVLSTTFLTAITFALGMYGCLVFRQEWELEFSDLTLTIIAIGLTSCFLGEICASFFCRKKLKFDTRELQWININNYKLVIFIVLQLITLVLYYREVKSIAGDAVTFVIMMSQYKDAIYATASVQDNVNIIVNQMAKISFVGTSISLYVFINNTMCKYKQKDNWRYMVPVIIFLGQTIISSSRSLILQLAVAGIMYYYIVYKMSTNWSHNIKFSFIRKVFVIALGVLLTFWGLKEIVGRITQNQGFFEYIAYYFSGGIAFFDQYIKNPYSNFKGIWGAETFSGILGFISKLSNNVNVTGNLEFRYSGTIHGNTYTAFREYYNDFGIWGVIICEMIFSFVYTIWIDKVKNAKPAKRNLTIIIFGFFAIPLVYGTIAAQFYRLVLSFTGLTYLVYICFMYWFFFKLRIKFVKRRVCIRR